MRRTLPALAALLFATPGILALAYYGVVMHTTGCGRPQATQRHQETYEICAEYCADVHGSLVKMTWQERQYPICVCRISQ